VTKYEKRTDPGEQAVAEAAVNFLTVAHSDAAAIRQKLHEVVERAAPFTRPKGAHLVSNLAEEIVGGKGFAGPLMNVRTRGYESDYLGLLDHAMLLWAKGKDFYAYVHTYGTLSTPILTTSKNLERTSHCKLWKGKFYL
jgi:hypothetical protein